MRFELFVALRYLKAKRRQSVISVVTVISILGVMAGVCALVVALAINNGFQEELEKSLLGATANVNLLRAQNDGIKDYEAPDRATQQVAPCGGVCSRALRRSSGFFSLACSRHSLERC